MPNSLIRLSFQVSKEQQGEFARVYDAQLAPILSRCGFAPADEPLRPMPDDAVARLFVIDSPLEISEKRQVLAQDDEWRGVLADMASRFGHTTPDGLLFYALELYRVSAGSGRVAAAIGQGAWRTYDATRGLASGFVFSMLEDRDGCL